MFSNREFKILKYIVNIVLVGNLFIIHINLLLCWCQSAKSLSKEIHNQRQTLWGSFISTHFGLMALYAVLHILYEKEFSVHLLLRRGKIAYINCFQLWIRTESCLLYIYTSFNYKTTKYCLLKVKVPIQY